MEHVHPEIDPAMKHLLLLVLLAATGAARAGDNAVTLYGGWRAGGDFTEVASGHTTRLDSSGVGALSLDFALDASRQWQLYLSRQKTELALDTAGASPLPLTVTTLQIGGTVFFDGPVGRGPYVVGGLGVTALQPGLAGYDNELRPSLSLGLGYQWPLAESLALRFETRANATLVSSSGQIFCSGGCVVAVKGSALTQVDALLGLSLRF